MYNNVRESRVFDFTTNEMFASHFDITYEFLCKDQIVHFSVLIFKMEFSHWASSHFQILINYTNVHRLNQN